MEEELKKNIQLFQSEEAQEEPTAFLSIVSLVMKHPIFKKLNK
jgi:hypothetical protein